MGFLGRNAEVAENELVKHELVQEAEVVFGRHRSVKFLVITNLGLLCIRGIGEELRLGDYTDHVGFKHRLYQILVVCSYRNADHQAFIKKDIVKRLCQLMQRSVRKEVKKELNDIRQRIYEVRSSKAKDERSADVLSYCKVCFWGD